VVDYKRAFAAIRRDSQWKRKIGLGVLISLIPYVGIVWMLGWQMEYQRNVAWGDDERIPDWSGFSRQALLGLKAYVAVLPYSLALSIITTPLLFVGMALGGLAADGGSLSGLLGMSIGGGVWFSVLMLFSLLFVPFTSSAMLRVSLYGTFESGFQFKEIWRLMREHKTELQRAWGFSVLNTGISFAAMVLYFGSLGLAMMLIPGPVEQRILAIIALLTVGFFVYMVLGMTLSLYLGLASMHYFGRYGRVAYDLDRARGQYGSAGMNDMATAIPDAEQPD